MTPAAVIEEIEKRGGTLTVENGQLKCKAPKGSVDPGLLEKIRQHKPAVIRHLVIQHVARFDDNSERFKDEDFTRKYVFLSKAVRGGAIDTETFEKGLGFLLDLWEPRNASVNFVN